MGRPVALLFDLDDTLVRDDEAVTAALFATCAGTSCPPEELFLAVWRRAHSLWGRLGHAGEEGRDLGVRPIEALMSENIDGKVGFAEPLEQYRDAVWIEAMAAVGSSGRVDVAQLTARLRAEALARYRLLPGTRDALGELQEDVLLGLVTNGPVDLQREKLRRLGLEPMFEAVVISAEVGCAKPDVRIFLRALELLGVERSSAVMIGNDSVEDVKGALDAGLAAIHLCAAGTGEETVAGVQVIGSVSQLPPILALGASEGGSR